MIISDVVSNMQSRACDNTVSLLRDHREAAAPFDDILKAESVVLNRETMGNQARPNPSRQRRSDTLC